MITKEKYGFTTLGNKEVEKYTLEKGPFVVSVITLGGTVVSIKTPNRAGEMGEITLGYGTLEEYEHNTTFFGTLVGRFANRIKGGKFSIDGKDYQVPLNDNGINSLHGGPEGFHSKVWQASTAEDGEKASLVLTYLSRDGEMGYPGNLDVKVTYNLYKEGKLEIDYLATTDKTTPVSLTNHAYFNLAGHGDILNHTLKLYCDAYLPVDENLIVSGALRSVKETPFDFTQEKKIGTDIEQVGGYDHCYVLTDQSNILKKCAYVKEEVSGRTMAVYTTLPGVQLYSGNFLNGTDKSPEGLPYEKHAGFCLETQHFPDAMNHPHFPNCLLKPQEVYSHKTVFEFNV